jgi:hypothetical protein
MKGDSSMKKKLLVILGFIFVLALGTGQAQAATWDLNLAGDVSNRSFYDFNIGSTNYSGWSLGLTGLTSFTALEGDTVNATITLDESVTMPASVFNTSVELGLYGANPSYVTSTSSTITFYNDDIEGSTFTTGSSSASWLYAGATLFGPDNSFTFDKIIINCTIDKIGEGNSLYLTNATLNAQMQNPAVPIPGAIWLLGSGVLGLLGFKRKFNK